MFQNKKQGNRHTVHVFMRGQRAVFHLLSPLKHPSAPSFSFYWLPHFLKNTSSPPYLKKSTYKISAGLAATP